MENLIRILLVNPKLSPSFRLALTYASAILFVCLVFFVSFSVNKYVSNTMSISLVEPETVIDPTDPEYIEAHAEESSSSYVVKKGDTLSYIFAKEGIPIADSVQITKLLSKQHAAFSLQVGQKIIFDYEIKITENPDDDLATETRMLNTITIPLDKINFIEIVRTDDGFSSKAASIPLKKMISKTSAVIDASFISTLKSLGLSTSNVIELVNAYSHQIDFQRQIKAGDVITVITEKFFTEDSEFSHYGKVLYASLNSSGKEINIYRYMHSGAHQFFSEDGKSVKRSLLRTPVKVIRVSSKFGKNRKHPIHGYAKDHLGVDFAAASGTPIYSAGDGVITYIGWKSGYGKLVQIKHSPSLSTAYAHASNFTKSLKVGSRVKQGDIIAYVGSTGNATGPHLHYEVLINGKHVNPMSVKTSPGTELTGKHLEKFQLFKKNFSTINARLENGALFAENLLQNL